MLDQVLQSRKDSELKFADLAKTVQKLIEKDRESVMKKISKLEQLMKEGVVQSIRQKAEKESAEVKEFLKPEDFQKQMSQRSQSPRQQS